MKETERTNTDRKRMKRSGGNIKPFLLAIIIALFIRGALPICGSSCKDCNRATQTCLQCHDSFFLESDNSCTPCEGDCRLCPTGANICLQCEEGFVRNPLVNEGEEPGVVNGVQQKSCLKCPDNCKICTKTSVCDKCKDRFKLSEGQCQSLQSQPLMVLVGIILPISVVMLYLVCTSCVKSKIDKLHEDRIKKVQKTLAKQMEEVEDEVRRRRARWPIQPQPLPQAINAYKEEYF